jgi:hypothetical protein
MKTQMAVPHRYLVFHGLKQDENQSEKSLNCYWLPADVDSFEFQARKMEELKSQMADDTSVFWSNTPLRK